MKIETLVASISTLLLGVAAASAQTSTWRPVVASDHGMVASGHPLASEAGLRILKSGGNAIDAAIATWAVQGLVEPMMTGIGGDMFILVYLARTGEVKFINGTGPAPLAATIARYREKGGIPAEGALSVSIPGAVSAAELAVKTYGSKSFAEVLAPAIGLAADGFPVTEHLARSLASSEEKLAKYPSTARIWFTDGRPLRMGERVVQKDIARTLERMARDGSSDFYRGQTAGTTVSYLKTNGGLITETDLETFQAHEDTPIHIDYKGIDVYECPPNSQGHVMLQALQTLEGFDLRYMGHNSARYLHLVTESLKLAFADRNHYVGDPRFVPPIPMDEMLSDDWAARRRAAIDPDRAFEGEPPAGAPKGSPTTEPFAYASARNVPSSVGPATEDTYGLTTYLAVVDEDRNMVSITSSLLSAFGSGMVVDGAGYFLNNRMAYFYLDESSPNALAPGKRTRHTINPALALKNGKPYLVFGTPGADTQPQAQLQFFLNVVEFGMNVQEALEQPAVISTSFESSYYPHSVEGTLRVPSSLPRYVLDELAALGHVLDVRDVKGVGSVKGILIHPETGVLLGGVSPTGDSYVMAW
jgi:gamma-glutamyltranspeptidase/glutathione hydrolase